MRNSDYHTLSRRISIISALLLTIFILIFLISCSGPMSDEPAGPAFAKPGTEAVIDAPEIQCLNKDVIYGKTYQEWAVEWTKWVISMPASANPLFDTAPYNQNQSDKVVFLCGSTQPGGITRNIKITPTNALFFPISNFFGWFDPGDPVNDYMNQFKNDFTSSVGDLQVVLDGRNIRIKSDYFVWYHGFSYDIPADNIFGIPAMHVNDGITIGYYLLLRPLTKGNHTLLIKTSWFDVTYNITVQKHI